jgi:archaellum component FlaC
MLVRTSGINARLTALETYVGEMREPRGMTLTSRLEAQHRMLVALGENQSETNRRLGRLEGRMTNVEDRLTGVETRLTGVETRLTGVENRLTEVEGTIGMVLHGVTAIKNLLRPPDDPPNGAPPP